MWCKNSRVNQSNMSTYRELWLRDHFLCSGSWKYEPKMSQNISWLPSITQPYLFQLGFPIQARNHAGGTAQGSYEWWQIEGSIGCVLLICKTDHSLYMSLHQYFPKKDGILLVVLWVSSPCVDCWCCSFLPTVSTYVDVCELIPSPNILSKHPFNPCHPLPRPSNDVIGAPPRLDSLT